MITKTGTGAHASETIFDTSALEAGFYQVGVRFETSGIPAGAGLLLSVSAPSPYPPVTAPASSGQPNVSSISNGMYLEAGASLSFSITPFGSMGSATPSWTAKFYLYRATDVS